MREIAILPPFLAIKPHFVRKGCARRFANRNFTSVLAIEPHFMRKGCAGCVANQFYRSFWRSNLIACERVAPDALQITTLLQFLAIEPHFVRRGCAGRFLQIATFHQFLAIELHFVRKGCAGRFANRNFTAVFGDRTSFRATGLRRTLCKSQLYLSFWRSNLISCEGVAPDAFYKSQRFISFWRSNFIACERVAPDALQIATFPQFLAIEPHFVRNGCVSCRLVGTSPRLKREIEKKERARWQESKRAREQERM